MVAITTPGSIEQIPLILFPKTNAAAEAWAIPCVDLSSPDAASAVVGACRSVGFFKATNHGVPAGLVDALESCASAFFALPGQEKRDTSGAGRPLGYGSKSIGLNGDVGWLEYLLLPVNGSSSSGGNEWSLPAALRAALEAYTAAVREVGGRVLELAAEGLGLERRALRGMVAGGDEMVRVNHYPPCPVAARERGCGVTGFGEHTDPQIVSVLRSNCTAGLQIKLADGMWVPVLPDPKAFFINVGDALQVLTNGRLRSVKHRVVAPEGVQSRLSFIYFAGPAPAQRIAPLPGVMRAGERSLYREFTWGEYKSAAYRTRLGDHRLGAFELATDSGREPKHQLHGAAAATSVVRALPATTTVQG